MIDQSIKKLITYALEKKLIKEEDKIYCTNSLLAILGLDGIQKCKFRINIKRDSRLCF